MLRWGILGTADAAEVAAPALRALGHDLAVIGAPSRTAAQAFAAGHGVRRARGGYQAVLEADDVDCVLVATPPADREPWVVAALEAGAHVLSQAPLALESDAAARAVAAAGRHGRVLAETRWARFHPALGELRRSLRGDEVGAARMVHATLTAGLPAADDPRLDPARGGGVDADLGSQALAAVRALAHADPDEVLATTHRCARGLPLRTAVLLRLPGGVVASVQVAYGAAPVDELVLVGAHGWLRAHGALAARDGVVGLWRGADGQPGTAAPIDGDGPTALLEAFAAAVDQGDPGPLPLEDVVADALVRDRITAAGRRGAA